MVIALGDTNGDLFRSVKSKAVLKTIQCRTKISQDSMGILIGYKRMNDLKQETITDREILLKMKSFPKQRFVTMTDNNLYLKYGYINNKKSSFTSNYMECHFALYHHFSLVKGSYSFAPGYYSDRLVQITVVNNIYYMACVCGRCNARSDWLIVTKL